MDFIGGIVHNAVQHGEANYTKDTKRDTNAFAQHLKQSKVSVTQGVKTYTPPLMLPYGMAPAAITPTLTRPNMG